MGKGGTGLGLNDKESENKYAQMPSQAAPVQKMDTSQFTNSVAPQQQQAMQGTNQYDKVLAYLNQMSQR